MLLSIVAWDDGQRAACESKVRTNVYLRGHTTFDAPGRAFALAAAVNERAVDAVRWTLNRMDEAETSDGFGFTSLIPAYALADAAESTSVKSDERLIMLQSLWDQLKPIDLAIVVRRDSNDDTLVDAAKDLCKRVVTVSPEDVWASHFGAAVAEHVIKCAPKRRVKKAAKKVAKKKVAKKTTKKVAKSAARKVG